MHATFIPYSPYYSRVPKFLTHESTTSIILILLPLYMSAPTPTLFLFDADGCIIIYPKNHNRFIRNILTYDSSSMYVR